ncbi:MAG: diadenylate cyclase [Deltaproteobacteria bacterium]|nr:diadenylate cyclase [Deltaproteobacteria bacterium]
MLELLIEPFRGASPLEIVWTVVDVLLVSALVYWALLLVRGTSSLRVAIGFIVIWAVFVLSDRLQLRTLHRTFDALFSTLSPLVVFMIVLFQDDIRRGLSRMTRWRRLTRIQEAETIDHVVGACDALAKEHIGAIIVFEGEAMVEPFTQSGTSIDAAVSKELLYSLFVPAFRNPTHDGAVIIKNLRIARAGAFLPSTKATDLAVELGTRHRAGIGITEVTDAVSIVVSEERGAISYCEDGAITLDVTAIELREILRQRLEHGVRAGRGLLQRLFGRRDTSRVDRPSQVGRQTIRPSQTAQGGGAPGEPGAGGESGGKRDSGSRPSAEG